MYQRLNIRKLAIRFYHANDNGETERVNHTVAQMLSMVVNKKQNGWDLPLPHVVFLTTTLLALRQAWSSKKHT